MPVVINEFEIVPEPSPVPGPPVSGPPKAEERGGETETAEQQWLRWHERMERLKAH